MPAPAAGYSGTPLAKKLGIADGTHLVLVNAPPEYATLLAPIPPNATFQKKLNGDTDIVHSFHLQKAALRAELERLRTTIKPAGAVWVSWPKKSSKVSTDITEDTIREIALPIGFVDIKVCAVSEVWSGLKLVIRKELR